MSQKRDTWAAVIGIDIGKSSSYIVGQNQSRVIVSRQKWPRGQVEARQANLPLWRVRMDDRTQDPVERTLSSAGLPH